MNKQTISSIAQWGRLPLYAGLYLKPKVESLRTLSDVVSYIHELYEDDWKCHCEYRLECIRAVREGLINFCK